MKIKINGRETEVEPGRTVIEACFANGTYVPHYCWHPGLTPAGNCRMCLVKAAAPPPAPPARGLSVACMTRVSEGLDVTTEGPEVDKARRDVMEFLLINHPLDCPICDKAGECALQDYTRDYRGGVSRFVEPKNLRHTKDLGPDIKIWGNRCIVCTRCVRFCEEISGTGELCVVNRGDRSVVDTFPGVPLDNPMSLNVVDICPVGALIDKQFLFQARVWYAKQTRTVCASCSRGCNGRITALDNEIKRFVAQPNPEVNQYWMCDQGRRNWAYVTDRDRLKGAVGTPAELAAAAKSVVERHGPGSLAGLVSAWQTVEEMWLFRKLMEALQASPVGVLTRTAGERRTFGGGFTIEPDQTPNRAGAEILLGAEAVSRGAADVFDAVRSGRARGLIVVNGLPGLEWPADVLEALAGLEFVGVIDLQAGPLAERAHVLLPGAAWAEKDGVFVNLQRRAQRIRPAVNPFGAACPEGKLLQEALLELGVLDGVRPAPEVFESVAAEVAEFAGLDYARLGDLGVPLKAAAAAEAAR